MKTTLNIDDQLFARLKREAGRRGTTMAELVETALRTLFQTRRGKSKLPPLPTFKSGGQLVDISNREMLYQAMEER